MGILYVLRALGRRGLARLPVLPIPDTDKITVVSPFPPLVISSSSAYVRTAWPNWPDRGFISLSARKTGPSPYSRSQYVRRRSGILRRYDRVQRIEHDHLPQHRPTDRTRVVSDCSPSIFSGLPNRAIVWLSLIPRRGYLVSGY